MTHERKNFIVRNESFICKNCGHKNLPLQGSCRNHCQKCLFSLHVELDVAGDRENACGGFMKPVSLEQLSKKGYVIVHRCLECGMEMKNKTADDDDFEKVIELSAKRIKKV